MRRRPFLAAAFASLAGLLGLRATSKPKQCVLRYRGLAVRGRVEDFKAGPGFSIALPNSRDARGDYKWSVEWPDARRNI